MRNNRTALFRLAPMLALAILCCAGEAAAQSGSAYEEFLRMCRSRGGVDVGGPNAPNCRINNRTPSAPAPLDTRLYWIGATIQASGDVTMLYPDGRRVTADAFARTPVPIGARVVTGPTGKLTVLLKDMTWFSIGPSSEMVLDAYIYDPGPDGWTDASLKFTKGTFRWKTSSMRTLPVKKAEVKIPVGSIGTRGTEFEIVADPGGSGHVRLIEGRIDFTEFGAARAITLKPGQKLTFENFRVTGVK
jgi:hypothetical protein